MNTQEITKIVFKLETLTEEQIRQENRDYNPAEWDKVIDRYKKYAGATFYVVRKGTAGFDYNQYFAKYQLPEGMIVFKKVSYSSTLSDSGFARIGITMDGTVYRHLFQDRNGNIGRAENSKENRAQFSKLSQEHGFIFSTEF
jgi:hypothetical protein